jgi:hypothetical protein
MKAVQRARCWTRLIAGTAMAARMPMITTTTMISTSVKPRPRFRPEVSRHFIGWSVRGGYKNSTLKRLIPTVADGEGKLPIGVDVAFRDAMDFG